ncbi:hypothetical protein CHS0354_008688 [Potamilus streckersoni]|uniref:Guanylate cyclase n=1 Tax=Potamilus streckersoni TaxID=2493646 RepID=A0AAE0THD5_9BIVA|nr:hypothetical protein CHS0354_008688 [Potamilus streckersoni]
MDDNILLCKLILIVNKAASPGQYRSAHLNLDMTYDTTGSGNGIARIKGDQKPDVDYAGSDLLLSDEDYIKYPDLQMFPVMAGAVVAAFNIPGVKNLNLTLQHLVGIYKGTIISWNHPSLQVANPELVLPNTSIIPIARRDVSGTTEIFTTALSLTDPSWYDTLGIFSEGQSSDYSFRWNLSVVKVFGYTNHGMTGMILSVTNSIGYVSIADAKEANLMWADIVNPAGNLVSASVQNVQNAMEDFRSQMSGRMTIRLVNAPGEYSYPLSAYTYFIVRINTMQNCDTAVELVRYIEWILTNEAMREESIQKDMVPILLPLASLVIENILKKITCNSQNVYNMMLQQVENENPKQEETWRIPTYVVITFLVACIIVASILLIRHQLHIHSELIKDKWKISVSEITTERISRHSGRSYTSIQTIHSIPAFVQQAWSTDEIYFYKAERVLVKQCMFSDRRFKLKTRKDILFFKKSINHPNVLKFFGLMETGKEWQSVWEPGIRGSIESIIHNCCLKLGVSAKIAILIDILKGMRYLHQKQIAHGFLRGSTCLVDSKWTVKVAHWEECKILADQDYKCLPGVITDYQQDYFKAKELYWTAPEIIKFNTMPTLSSDLYSFAMVIQEVFSQENPYYELRNTHTPSEIIQAVIACYLRPTFNTVIPASLVEIMEKLWDADPFARPNFHAVHKKFKVSFPTHDSVMDCMMKSMDDYVHSLEARVNEIREESNITKHRMKHILMQYMPEEVINAWSHGHKINNEDFSSASVIVCKIKHDYLNDTQTSMDHINTLHRVLDNIIRSPHCVVLGKCEGYFVCVTGVSVKATAHAQHACQVAKNIMHWIQSFSNELGLKTMLPVKIGIGSGRVTVGVIGDVVPKYAVVGDGNKIAYEMYRLALYGKVRISQQTYFLLPEESDIKIKKETHIDKVPIQSLLLLLSSHMSKHSNKSMRSVIAYFVLITVVKYI